jgi:hypothetical protein
MQRRRTILSVVLAAPMAAGWANPAPGAENAAGTRSSATQPATTQSGAPELVIPSDPQAIRDFIAQMRSTDAVLATDAAVRLKLLAKRGVPVWNFLEDTDPVSARQLLTWLRNHPGDIHRPSPLRMDWDAKDVFIKQEESGKTQLLGNADLIEYARLAREIARDGDPYGYYAILEVGRTATELLSREPDYVIYPYVVPYLEDHLHLHAMTAALGDWRSYWAKPFTVKRAFRSPIEPQESDGTPVAPLPPWQVPTRYVLEAMEIFRTRLEQLGLWQVQPWERQYTRRTDTPALLKGMIGASFPTRQHIWRLLCDRMGDPDARKQVAQAIEQGHPSAAVLRLALDLTPLMPYAEAIRRAWPKELAEQCPGTLEDLVSSNPRRRNEGALVTQTTLLYWPDRTWANRTAVQLFEAAGAGATEFSIGVLMTVDNKEGVTRLLNVYRKGDLSDAFYNIVHRWMNDAVGPFRTACADKDLAPLILKLTTASQPAIDTSKKDWSKILRMAYELVWWDLNAGKLYWNERTGRLEVPSGELVHPTEEQILSRYATGGKMLRDLLDAARSRRADTQPKRE